LKLSACLTIANRSPEVCQQVADSLMLPGNTPDELVIVLDRCTPEVKDGARAAYDRLSCPVRWIAIPGEPGWRSPVKAWNLAFLAATGDVLYCFSSETVQAEGNLDRAKRLISPRFERLGITEDGIPEFQAIDGPDSLVLHGSVSCSCGPAGQEVNWNGQAPGNLFCDAAHPRPLGFIWAAPRTAVNAIAGYDEEFSKGFWYDDNDFFYRLWRLGLDFAFDDNVRGTHLHHDRPTLETMPGQHGIARNQEYMFKKHGTLDPMGREQVLQTITPGRTTWRHP
jgi:hypothetical protein